MSSAEVDEGLPTPQLGLAAPDEGTSESLTNDDVITTEPKLFADDDNPDDDNSDSEASVIVPVPKLSAVYIIILKLI